MAVHRAPQASGRWRKLVLIVVPPVVLLAGAAALFIAQPEEPTVPLDADLCPLGEVERPQAVLLLDLRKPLGGQAASLAVDALRDVTFRSRRHTELRVFALTSDAAAPRLLVRRFCKPYANEVLSVGSAKDVREARDCDDLPAQLTAQAAEDATRFCALRSEVDAAITRLTQRPLVIPVPNAFLVEAIEETSLAFGEQSGARSLYVFSDMLQHAGWFSHAERGSQGWDFNDFIFKREMEETSVGPRPPPLDGIDVTVYYVLREGVTDAPRAKMNHVAFWRQYLSDALGAAPAFKEVATLPSYSVEPLLERLTETERLAQERKRLEAESKRLERATAEYEAAQQRARQAAERAAAERAAAEEAAAEEAAERAAAEEAEVAAAEEARDVAQEMPGEEAAPEEVRGVTQEAPAQAQPPPDIAQAEPPPPADEPPAEDAPPLIAEPPPEPTPSAPAVVAAAPDAEPEPPSPPAPSPSAELAAAVDGADGDDPDASCSVVLQERFQTTNAYPIKNRRLNLGAADIAVEFAIDAQGRTVDDTVRVIQESSTATRPNYFDAFAEESRKLVREWVFDFAPGAAACSREQVRSARVKFKY